MSNQDGNVVLQKIFLQRPTPTRAFDGVYSGTVVTSDSVNVTVTLDQFDAQATWLARYERRPGASPATPPAGTRCLVAFPPNELDGSPWAITFVGWP